MRTNLDDITAIRAYLLSIWNPAIPLVLDNEAYVDRPDTVWARFSVAPGASSRASIAQRTYKQKGRVNLQVFVPNGDADGDGWTIADEIGRAFTDLNLDSYRIRFETPEYRTGDEADKPYMVFMTIMYRADH